MGGINPTGGVISVSNDDGSITAEINLSKVPNPNLNFSLNTSGGYDRQEVERYIYVYTNEERQRRGLSPLIYNDQLVTPARKHSQNMAESGELFHGDIQSRYPCRYTGENAAQNYDEYDNEETAQAIVDQWMSSPGHRKNILRESYSSIGVGVHKSGSEIWATQGFCG